LAAAKAASASGAMPAVLSLAKVKSGRSGWDMTGASVPFFRRLEQGEVAAGRRAERNLALGRNAVCGGRGK
jgi:hypothetical protein